MSMPFALWRFLVRCRLAKWLPGVQRVAQWDAGFLHYYSDRVLLSPVAQLQELQAAREPVGPHVIDLASAAPRSDLAPSGSTKLPAEQRGYPLPQGLLALREIIAARLRDRNGLDLSPREEILITSGVSGAFNLVLDTFLNRGDRVVLFDPSSFLYSLAVRNRGGRVHWVTSHVEKGRIRYSLTELVRALGRARLLVLNSPANPTGGVFAADDLEEIAWWCDRHDVLVFNDEVYHDLQYDGQPVSITSFPRAWRRTLTAASLSCSHAFAAYRVGWLAGPRQLLLPCAMSSAVTGASVPTLCQQLAVTALQASPEAQDKIREGFAERRQYVVERLRHIGLCPVRPAGALFVWLPVASLNLTGRKFADALLREKQVKVLPGESFGPSGCGHVRVSFAGDEGRLREGLNRLAEFVRSLAPLAQPARLAA
jgi:aspartate/methionine/tyrosine aminotransferase